VDEAALRAMANRIAAADRAAEAELARAIRPVVERVVCRRLSERSQADMDDVVQESLIGILNGVGGLPTEVRILGWAASVASNQARLFFRKERTRLRHQARFCAELRRTGGALTEADVGQRLEVLALLAAAEPPDRAVAELLLQGRKPKDVQAELALTRAKYRSSCDRLWDILHAFNPAQDSVLDDSTVDTGSPSTE
jgi:DNA-directed RNA polymerase specialized sigma24 family protein